MSKQGDEIVSRRKILTGGGLLAGSAAFVAGTGLAGTAEAQGGTYTEANARQEVEYLRRWYGVATDLLGLLNSEDPTAFNEGRKIYRRIFTPDALISINGTAYVDPTLDTTPDQWADFVHGVLAQRFSATQHLLGTQTCVIDELPSTSPARGATSGHATMSSYLQAWHEVRDAGITSVFIGTYFDKCKISTLRSGLHGWQIYEMNLVRVSGGTWALTLPE